jgi:anti-sigma B factor antagonist
MKGGHMSLEVAINKKEQGVFTVSCSGSIDSTTYMILDEKLSPLLVPATRVIIFNMQGVNYISSMGLGVIFKANNILEKHKGRLMMTNLQPQVKSVFEIIKALPEQAMFTSMEEADAYLTEIQKKEI